MLNFPFWKQIVPLWGWFKIFRIISSFLQDKWQILAIPSKNLKTMLYRLWLVLIANCTIKFKEKQNYLWKKGKYPYTTPFKIRNKSRNWKHPIPPARKKARTNNFASVRFRTRLETILESWIFQRTSPMLMVEPKCGKTKLAPVHHRPRVRKILRRKPACLTMRGNAMAIV